MRGPGRGGRVQTCGDGSRRDELASGEKSWRALYGAGLVLRRMVHRPLGEVRGPPKGRRLGRASTARAEPSDTCRGRANARRTASPGARSTSSSARLFTSARGCYF